MGPHDDRPVDDLALARYCSGESSIDERQAIETWIAADAAHFAQVEKIRAVWGPAGDVKAKYPIDHVWQAISREMSGDQPKTPRLSVMTQPVARHSFWWLSLVAVAGVLMMIGIGVRVGGPQLDAPGREYATTPGQRLSVTLSDGTQFTLGPESHVRVASGYGVSTRDVELNGEGYFTVVHNAAHSFTVHAGGVTTRDVGTVFDVRAYDTDVQVAVAEGAVTVGAGRDPAAVPSTAMMLHGGDVAHISPLGMRVVHNANVADLTAWRQGHLVFEDTPLRDVVRDLDRTFNVHITIADSSLATHQVSGSFDNESVDQVMDDLTGVIGAQYERAGRNVTIRRRTSHTIQNGAHAPPPLTTAQATQAQ